MLENLNCVSKNVNLDDYLYLYKYVRDNMENPEWLGTFTKEEIIESLKENYTVEQIRKNMVIL